MAARNLTLAHRSSAAYATDVVISAFRSP